MSYVVINSMYYNVGDIMNKKLNFRMIPSGYGKASKEVREYITSLEQKRRHDLCFIDHLKKDKLDLQQEIERLNNRISKAIEYIENIINLQEVTNGIITPTRYTNIKNILQNGSDKNE